MAGWAFVDFGPGHVVIDDDGEPVRSSMNIRSDRCRGHTSRICAAQVRLRAGHHVRFARYSVVGSYDDTHAWISGRRLGGVSRGLQGLAPDCMISRLLL